MGRGQGPRAQVFWEKSNVPETAGFRALFLESFEPFAQVCGPTSPELRITPANGSPRRMLTPPPPARTLLCIWIGALATPACVYDHQLLDREGVGGSRAGAGTTSGAATQGGDGGDSSAGEDGNPNTPPSPKPWNEASCLAAVGSGASGDPCSGNFKCSGSQDCCQTIAGCEGEKLVLNKNCDACVTSCSADSDCKKTGQICENYQCRDCPTLACPTGWTSVLRNDCVMCVPPRQCKADIECPSGETCFAGASCLPGCKEDPACCFGNQCGWAACGRPTNLDCTIVGCAPGTFCKAAGPPGECKCDPSGGKWICSTPAVSSCFAY